MYRLRFQPGTSRIRGRSVDDSTTTFGAGLAQKVVFSTSVLSTIIIRIILCGREISTPSYLGGPRFEYRPVNWLYFVEDIVVFLSPFRQMLRYLLP